jgi:predicted ATPase
MKPEAKVEPFKGANPVFKRIRISGPFAKKMWSARFKDFDFKPGVNILCGPNGSGKSTILKALFPKPKKNKDEFSFDMGNLEESIFMDTMKVKVWGTSGALVRRFDFEMNNPRVHRGMGMMEMTDFIRHASAGKARQMSHGEAQKALFDAMLTNEATKSSILLLDEPEQALDLDGITKLLTILRKTRRQYIISTHSPFLVLEKKFNILELKYRYVHELRAAYKKLLG